jgi:uncharacterized protein YndB with AHSA1/START domain
MSNASPEVTISRLFDAPRELVFKAWTDPEHVKQWWGPRYFTVPTCELDVRPGGAVRIDMQGPDGTLYPNTGFFQEVVEPERLVVVTRAFEDEDGNAKLEGVTTVTFVERDGKTELTVYSKLTKVDPEVSGAAAGMEQGWTESIDKLEEHLATA